MKRYRIIHIPTATSRVFEFEENLKITSSTTLRHYLSIITNHDTIYIDHNEGSFWLGAFINTVPWSISSKHEFMVEDESI